MRIAWWGSKELVSPPPFLLDAAAARGFSWSVYGPDERPAFEGDDAVLCHVAYEKRPWADAHARLLHSMRQRKPVIASGLASEVTFVRNGVNAMLAPRAGDWEDCLDLLRGNPAARETLAQVAAETASRLDGAGGADRPVVAFYVGPGLERWDERSMTTGIGGSETAVIELSRRLSRLGHEVLVFADPLDEHWDSSGDRVQYLRHEQWSRYADRHRIDHLISSRTVAPLLSPTAAGKKYVWIHDVALGESGADVCVEEVDAYLCLSDWHKSFVHAHHGIPLDKIVVTTNGIDPSRFEGPGLEAVERNPTQVIYSSSPDRGLDTLLECSDEIARHVPGYSLCVAYGFRNWKALIELMGDRSQLEAVARIERGLGRPFVKYLDRIGQADLARIQRQSAAWLYPTRFTETNCITAIEAGSAGCAILSSHLAGLTTTVTDEGGILLRGDAYDPEYRERFVAESVRLLTDRAYRDEWGERARQRMRALSWDNVAMQWQRFFATGEMRRLS